jgi:RNA polymerase sigma factor (sigma-70 family)
MAQPATDEDLMQRAGRGDQEAFAELVRRHHGALYGFFRRRALDRHAAEDCVQDTLLRLLRASDTYRPQAPFGAFLVRLARNTLVDWRRRRREGDLARDERRPGGQPVAGREAEARPGVSAGDRLDLAQAVSRLSVKLRVVVELSIRDGLNHVEIARLLGVPHNTVKTRMHWAVRKLRERMNDEP